MESIYINIAFVIVNGYLAYMLETLWIKVVNAAACLLNILVVAVVVLSKTVQ